MCQSAIATECLVERLPPGLPRVNARLASAFGQEQSEHDVTDP